MTAERRIVFWAFGLALFLFLIWLLAPVLPPFVLGLGIAYLLDPPVTRLAKRGMPRWVAVSLILGGFFILLILLAALLLPLLEAQVRDFIQRAPAYQQALEDRFRPLIESLWAQLPPEMIDRLKEAAGSSSAQAADWAGAFLRRIWAGGVAVFGVLYLLILTPLVAFYILLDWDDLVRTVDDLLPRVGAPIIRQQVRAIDRIIAGFLRGQATVCLVLGIYYGIGLTVVRLEFGLLIGLATGLMAFIPYIGFFIGFVVAMIVAYVQFHDWASIGMVIAVFAVGQVVEGNFLTPKLVGERIGLHPVWVIFALFTGGTLFGFTGVLLAVPTAAVIGVLVRFGLDRYRNSPYYSGH
jgi:predicted PurR-regulated permease PerM